MAIRLETERLILRTPTLDDAEALARAIDHPDIAEQTLNIPHPYSVDDAKMWIGRHVEPEEEIDDIALTVFIRETGELIGGIGLIDINRKHNKAELGFWCAVDHWGNGYITEASLRAVQYGFEDLGLVRVYAICLVTNPASRRVMEKIGMKFEGTAYKEYQKNGEYFDFHHYSILKDDWEK